MQERREKERREGGRQERLRDMTAETERVPGKGDRWCQCPDHGRDSMKVWATGTKGERKEGRKGRKGQM